MAIKQRTKSLHARHEPLSDTKYQLTVLNDKDLVDDQFTRFDAELDKYGKYPLRPSEVEIFQINIGKLCNQSCAHCHVDAGPDRVEEQMTRKDLERCLAIIDEHQIPRVDITGGAPELNENFRWFVEECRRLRVHVMDRCNLTVIMSNPKYRDLPYFFADNQVQVISSLPYFTKRRTDSQRGDGVFEDSIEALKLLNQVGYGREGSGLVLDLVYNPTGTFLPSSQAQLQDEFKRQLKRRYDIDFNSLYTITNLPISRFLEYLIETEQYTEYMTRLTEAFNPSTIDGLMCKNTISVSWDGYIYDCDFNQMLDLKVNTRGQHISEFDMDALRERSIVVNQHCYGCTAGAGSSCGGELI